MDALVAFNSSYGMIISVVFLLCYVIVLRSEITTLKKKLKENNNR